METFYYVVKAGSFTNAENLLNKSQSALSRTVDQLEHRLGHRLLNRKIKGLTLTRKGEEVFRTVQHMVLDVDGMKTNLNEQKGMTGKIRISMTYALANYVISKHFLDFNAQYPDIRPEIICSDDLIDIIQQEVDLIITPHFQEDSALTQHHLTTMQPGLYASPAYLEKFGRPKDINDLDHHRFLAYPRPAETSYFDVEWHLKAGLEQRENLFIRQILWNVYF